MEVFKNIMIDTIDKIYTKAEPNIENWNLKASVARLELSSW